MTARFALLLVGLALTRTMSAQDFTLSLEPNTAKLVQGQSTSFVISLAPFNGFTSQVSLAVATLPAGVTAQFSPATLTLPGTSVLQLTAATNQSQVDFALNIIATGGGITNTTSSSVSVVIGLLPICTGAFQGQVTDIQSGLPVPGAVIQFNGYYYTTADASGNYIITNVSLGSPDNTPEQYGLSSTRTDYWQSAVSYAFAVCDATNVVNLQMIKKQFGSISGQVTAQGGGSLSNVLVNLSGAEYTSTNTDANGSYQIPGLQLSYSNAPGFYSLQFSVAGYWQTTSNTIVQANSNSVVNAVLIPICTATIHGSVIFGDTGLPVTNTYVYVSTYNDQSVLTDSQGDYTATNVYLGEYNNPVNAGASASYAGYYGGSVSAQLSSCGQILGMPTLVLKPVPPPPTNNYGDITGHIYDVQSGLPLTNAYVYVYYQDVYAYTDTNGAYYLTNVLVGTGGSTNTTVYLIATDTGYFSVQSNVNVYADEVVTQDFQMLKIGFGAVVGTVRDSVTTLPVTNAYVSIAASGEVNSNGYYASNPLQLTPGNLPTEEYINVSAIGYWGTSTNTTVTDGNTNVVDISLLKVCTGATILGNVVDAITQKPITNASVQISGSQYYYTTTDTNGAFIFTNVTVGDNNSPIQNSLTASAPGYNPQTKTVTIFCNATIITEFGQAETAFGSIDGFVTNVVTGLPLTNVFVGTSFGGSTYTDTNGYYEFDQAPLGLNGANATWTVTAIPAGFLQQSKPVIVSSNMDSRLDFGFGQPPTALIVTATGTPDPVNVGSNLLYLVTLTNTVADAQAVVLADALPPGVTYVSSALTNSPGTPFSAPVYSNNVVTTSATDFGSNSAVTVAIVVVPTAVGTLTNVATVTSSTTDLDPTGSNHMATVFTDVIAPPAPPTELIVTLVSTPPTVPVGSNLLYTVTLTNTVANATTVTLVDTLPPFVDFVTASVSNPPGGTFSQPTFADGAVTISAPTFSSNSAVTLFITVTPTVAGALTNTVNVTSATTNLAPGTTLSAMVTNAATATADLALLLTENAEFITLGSNVDYTLVVTNLGPDDAPDAVLDDTLPAGAVYVSATTSQGTATPGSGTEHWDFGALSSHASATATLVVTPGSAGIITNGAVVSLVPGAFSVTDPYLGNNTQSITATVTALVNTNPPPLTNVTVQALGPIVFNPQTGLYQQTVLFTNLSGVATVAIRIGVLDLPSFVTLYNATGTTNGVPYVEYDQSVAAGGGAVFLLEYYDVTRQPFVSTNFVVTALGAAAPAPSATGTVLQLDRIEFISEGQLTIEFASVPGHTYVVQYADSVNPAQWNTAWPPIIAVNTKTEWIDAGPPKTTSPPGAPGVAGQRYYRVVQTN